MPTTYPNIDSVVRSLGGKRLLGAIRTFADLNMVVGPGLALPEPGSTRRPVCGSASRSHVEQIVAPRTTLQRREREGILLLATRASGSSA